MYIYIYVCVYVCVQVGVAGGGLPREWAVELVTALVCSASGLFKMDDNGECRASAVQS
jgi:hypothetical protein